MNSTKFRDSYLFSYVLTFIGGYLGGYSYILRGEVFASAQTGNVILLGINLANGNYSSWYLFVIPIFAFSFGIVFTEFLRNIFHGKETIWIQLMLTIEMLVLILVAFIPTGSMDVYANVSIAFTAAIQLQTFKKVGDHAHSTTMCTGNIRNLSELFYISLYEKDKKKMVKWFFRSLIIVFFALGVVISYLIVDMVGVASILFAAFIVFVLIVIFFFDK